MAQEKETCLVKYQEFYFRILSILWIFNETQRQMFSDIVGSNICSGISLATINLRQKETDFENN
jgi:hypothetical protein